MDLKDAVKSFAGRDGDRAVSPVIGVILMVAITVILAAVIGTFVLGLGDRVSQASPNTNFGFDYSTAGNSDRIVDISHDGGDAVNAEQTKVLIDGTEAWNGDEGFSVGGYTGSSSWSGKITAGDSLRIQEDGSTIASDATIKVVWSAEGGDKTAVIGESEASY